MVLAVQKQIFVKLEVINTVVQIRKLATHQRAVLKKKQILKLCVKRLEVMFIAI